MKCVPAELQTLTPAGDAEQPAFEICVRHHDLLVDMTMQILGTNNLDERLSLSLEVITRGLGYSRAALALIDEKNEILRLRRATGFADDAAVEGLKFPVDSAPQVSIIHDGRPAWISADQNESAAAFLAKLGCHKELLALPLFGVQMQPKKTSRQVVRRPKPSDTYWSLETEFCVGILYIGANRSATDDMTLKCLTQFSDCIGISAGSALQTERLTAAISKFQSERQWIESIMKSVADPIVLTNLDNQILLQNRRAEELFSGSDDAGEGKRRALKMNDLLFSAYLSSAAVLFKDLIQRDITLVDPIEGSDLHFEVVSTPALSSRGDRIGLVSIFRDVTDLRHANEELAQNFMKLQQAEAEARRERDRLDLIIENVGHPVAVCDAGGNFILFNARADALFQQNPEIDSTAAAAMRGNAVKLTSFISALASGSETGRQAEIEIIEPTTGKSLPMEITSGEVLDAKGQVTAVVSILHDLSEIRELEHRRVEQQLFESEKLAAVGRLAASIAHEVNNPLEAIKNSLYLLQNGKEDSHSSVFLEVARKETERVSHIIRQMLGFARHGGEVEWVNANQLLEETLALVQKQLRLSGINVSQTFDQNLPPIRARGDQLRQVFLNLILNAQQAIEKKGEIRIKTSRKRPALRSSISIEISDNGPGISEEDLPHIFEPFFTTRKSGTGLGLWVTHDIVRQHGGIIEVTSDQNLTTFNVTLLTDSPTLTADGNGQSAGQGGTAST
jgi:PAS domain S-box-containing protein